jgi:hypothetical protein
MQMCSVPPVVPNSIENCVTMTISFGVATLANCVCISERTYSNCNGFTLFHDAV